MKETTRKINAKQALTGAAVLLFWLAVWGIAARIVGKPYLFASPADTLLALWRLLPQREFWTSILHSLSRIGCGFLAGFLCGVLAAALSAVSPVVKRLLSPALRFLQSVPVASFVVLALIWFGSGKLSGVIAFTVVFPLFYFTVQKGLDAADPQLLEMARVFRVRPGKVILKIYVPSVLPYLTAACMTAVGMSWKSGLAAEIIGLPAHSIGEKLYNSKVYLDTADLFAWTITIILVSMATEKAVLWLVRKAGGRLGA